MRRSLNCWFAAGRWCVVAAVLACGAQRAVASFVAITTPTNTATDNATGQYTLGYEFQTGAVPLTVTALGVWDKATGSPNLNAAHEVAIYDPTTLAILTSQVVPASASPSGQIGDYAYVPLVTSYVLSPNTQYIIVTEENKDDAFHNSTDTLADYPVFNPNITFVQRTSGALGPGNTVTFPAGSLGSAWDAPNFTFSTPTPEPSTFVLLAIGLAAYWLRRCQRS